MPAPTAKRSSASESGGKATYRAQRYSVDFVGSLAHRLGQVAVVCAVCEEPYDVVLSNGLRASVLA